MIREKHSILIPDPIYDSIFIPERFLSFIDNPVFQRLRYLKQLSFANLIFPSATHTRFEHSLGVFHLAYLTINKLMVELEYRYVIPEIYENNAEALKLIDSSKKELEKIIKESSFEFLIAALYHDIGHGTFGHVINYLNKRNPEYNKKNLFIDKSYSKELIEKDEILQQIFNEFNKVLEAEKKPPLNKLNIIEMIVNGKHTNPLLSFLGELIQSPLDLDRLDYLNRDCYHTGILNTKIPYNYIISKERIRCQQ